MAAINEIRAIGSKNFQFVYFDSFSRKLTINNIEPVDGVAICLHQSNESFKSSMSFISSLSFIIITLTA
jgi:hypothetical protein